VRLFWVGFVVVALLAAAPQRRPKAAAGKAGAAKTAKSAGSRKSAPPAAPVSAATGVAIALTAPVSAGPEVRKWMESLTLRQQVAQLIIVACYGEAPGAHTREFQNFAYQVQAIGVGGLIVNNRVVNGLARNAEPQAMVTFLNRMQGLAKVPLIVGGDFERGASMRVANTTKFPHAMAYGAARDYAATKLMGLATAREARALGVHWIFAPDSDVNNNPDNPIINTRSYGEKPEEVAQHVRAFIEGAHSDARNRVLVTAKHFPGHGDTAVDTHVGLAKISADRQRLESVEFVPFRSAIAAGVDAVMSGHLAVAALEPEEIPSSVSKNILTGVLREQLGFKGLVVTDAMDMRGLSSRFTPAEAAVRALEAGVDVLLMPSRPDLAVQGVMDALASGRLSRERVRDSLVKILAAKVRLGLERERLTPVERLADSLDTPEFTASARQVAEKALTLLKNDGGVLPLRDPANACLLVLAENRLSLQGRQMIEVAMQRSPGLRAFWLDSQMARNEVLTLAAKTDSCSAVVVAAFVNAAGFRGGVALLGAFPELVETLTKSAPPVVLVAMGSPYLLRSFPAIKGAVASCSAALPAEAAVVRALWGEIGFEGRLPVSIPGFAELGAGLQVARRAPTVHGGASAVNE
jgi:beta-N-acetylhexosaminidase